MKKFSVILAVVMLLTSVSSFAAPVLVANDTNEAMAVCNSITVVPEGLLVVANGETMIYALPSTNVRAENIDVIPSDFAAYKYIVVNGVLVSKEPVATATPVPEETPSTVEPTTVPVPTEAPFVFVMPTATPEPTATPAPTVTPVPTEVPVIVTPVPVIVTPIPTAVPVIVTPVPTEAPVIVTPAPVVVTPIPTAIPTEIPTIAPTATPIPVVEPVVEAVQVAPVEEKIKDNNADKSKSSANENASINSTVKKNTDLGIQIDGNIITTDVAPVIKNNRTLVPLRAIGEGLGAKIDWDAKTKTVTAVKGDKIVKLTIDDKKVKINNDQLELDVPAELMSGRTMVPIRFIAEAFGAHVLWNDIDKVVVITQ